VIRRATADDVEAVVDVFERISETMTYLPVVHTHEEHLAWFGARLSDREGWVWDEGGVRGYMLLGDGELMHIYLAPGWTDRGIGTQLLQLAKARLPGGFTLWTFQQNHGARRWYERHGLEAIEFGDGSGNEEGVADVKYAWRPSPRSCASSGR
jgi:ribosomal protein S18 acetylase RimI-like enzyme